MKVNIKFITTDENGDSTEADVFAVMEKQGKQGYRLVYVEDLSGNKKMTRSTLQINPRSMRVTKRGEVISDLIYEEGLVHHAVYGLAFGNIPISVKTEKYLFEEHSDGSKVVDTTYSLSMNEDNEPPLLMNLHISITECTEC
ncbi:MAG: DUF1934 domain-containing protein [Clostridium sp.]|nr:DUF1934 domain-containing protein [Clostridium sp.]MCM1460756.1 DUF1934 domain-containing protein [Bacteroides sp.]